MNKLVLNPPFDRLWPREKAFDEAAALDGEEFRRVKSRRTFRFEVAGFGYFMKYHHGVGWREIIKNWLQFKLPVLGAGNEFRALARLHEIGVPTMSAAAFGQRGWNPAALESFLITRELTGVISLEDFCRDWRERPPSSAVRHRLVAALARSVGAMHAAGINHRDCYLCHFLLECGTEMTRPQLLVIDLHRAQLRRRLPLRYRIKDLAGLRFSALDCGLTRRDVLRFKAVYLRLNPGIRRSPGIAWRVVRASERLYRREYGAIPPEVR